MTGGVRMEFPATTISEAVMTATARWRTMVEDPEATLPWSTNIEFYEETEPELKGGRFVDSDPQMMALVRIEFDRKVVEEVIGATSAA